MAKVKVVCQCNNTVVGDTGQSLRNGNISWYLSYKCNNCGNVIEEDGGEDIPEDIRNAIILDEGEWGLKINSQDSKFITKGLLLIKEALNLSLNHVSEMKKLFPGSIITGTKTEIIRIYNLLEVNGIKSTIEKI